MTAPTSSSSPSPPAWDASVAQLSGSKRRHRSEVDSRRRQKEADLLRRLLALSSTTDGSVDADELDDVVDVIDEGGQLRRRRIQKLDILERASAAIERLQGLVANAHQPPPQPRDAQSEEVAEAPSTEGVAAVELSASETDPIAALNHGLTRSLHSALSSLGQRWQDPPKLQLPLKPAPPSSLTPSSPTTAVDFPSTLPALPQPPVRSPVVFDLPPFLFGPTPSPLELPLECHVQRCVAEWYEEAYRRSRDPGLLRQVAFHWLQAAKADPDSSLPWSPFSSSSSSSSPHYFRSSLPPSPSSSATTNVSHVDLATALVTHDGSRLPPTPPPTLSAVSYCRHRAIHWLREAATAAVGQGVHWDMVKWLKRAAELIDELPDHRSFRWRRELLRVLSLYCSSYSCLVGITQSVAEWSRLCSLCDEVQQQLNCVEEDGRRQDELSSAVTLTTFYALRGCHLALNASTRSPIDLAESSRVCARMQAIAQRHPSYLVQAHALYVQAIEHIHLGHYADTIRVAHQAWQLCVEHYPPHATFVVNPLAPLDPGVGALCCASNGLCLLGRFSEAVEHADRCVNQAALNREPVTWQWVLGMRCYMLSQLEEFDRHADHFLAYLHYSRRSAQGPSSTLYETVLALYQISQEPQLSTPEVMAKLAATCWGRYEKGDSFIISFSSSLCDLLSRAGMWREGLRLVDDWRLISGCGRMSFYFPNCLRYRAKFLLQQADALEEEQRLHSDTRGVEEDENGEEGLLCGHQVEDELPSSLFTISADWPASPPATLQLSEHGLWDVSLLSDPTLPELGTLSSFASPPLHRPLPPAALVPAVHQLRDEAVECLREAICLAERLQARLLEMQAVLDLLQLLEHTRSRAVAPVAPLSASRSEADEAQRLRERLRRLLDECGVGHQSFVLIQRAQRCMQQHA